MPHDDDDDRPDGRTTWTRSQLLKARGYSDEILNGHTTPEVAETATEPPPDPGPVCRQCGEQLDGPATRQWCDERCRRRWRTEHEPPRQRPAPQPDGSREVCPSQTSSGSAVPLASDGQPAPNVRTDIEEVVAVLLERPWAELVVRLDRVTVTVARDDRPIVTGR